MQADVVERNEVELVVVELVVVLIDIVGRDVVELELLVIDDVELVAGLPDGAEIDAEESDAVQHGSVEFEARVPDVV